MYRFENSGFVSGLLIRAEIDFVGVVFAGRCVSGGTETENILPGGEAFEAPFSSTTAWNGLISIVNIPVW